ncbi:MAG: preprotein translocase subunit YajC [Oscillospiraceae bacterium]|nr:preprotein translocase subunit YajC [Oscillospiraceae bacterium]
MINTPYLLTAAVENAGEGSILDTIISFAPIVVVLIVFYFMLIRPQQKKDKEDRAMRENLDIGDEIVTIGGIMGIVSKIGEDYVVIETGGDRSKIRLTKTAVAQNISAKEKADAEK